VLNPNGRFVLTDLFSIGLVPTRLLGHSDRVRTRRGVQKLLRAAGFVTIDWRHRYSVVIGTVVASK
jgi:hypothetical protein